VKIHPDLDLFQLAFIEAKVVELGPEQARLAYSSNAHVSVFARNYLRIRFQDWVSRFGRDFLPSGMDPAQEGVHAKGRLGQIAAEREEGKKTSRGEDSQGEEYQVENGPEKREIHGKVGDRRISQMGRTPRFCRINT